MPDAANQAQDRSLFDTMERIRAEQFPHIDRELVREILRLHADQAATPQVLARAVDEAIAQRLGETA
jgi:hypothetical protein